MAKYNPQSPREALSRLRLAIGFTARPHESDMMQRIKDRHDRWFGMGD